MIKVPGLWTRIPCWMLENIAVPPVKLLIDANMNYAFVASGQTEVCRLARSGMLDYESGFFRHRTIADLINEFEYDLTSTMKSTQSWLRRKGEAPGTHIWRFESGRELIRQTGWLAHQQGDMVSSLYEHAAAVCMGLTDEPWLDRRALVRAAEREALEEQYQLMSPRRMPRFRSRRPRR